ncbi:FliM/FliN family flagellar motor switch protein [Spongiibacter sp. KMU-158]|uniref:Flagellar motor switch protein FliM n=1 Tax=Spongiibacter pelagi TaxID=2760804 RepID=A0A927GWH6_9GAMM|nr:flagellar motor switch protein FliM [Spongiibacter pelagi]MBD2858439.1 FliM/FliN family flagellar motor switch protein [Spongiibacter pelagi]
MSGVLEPEEIEALMSGNAEEGESAQSASGKFDFAHHDYAVQRLIPALSLIQSQFASAVRDQLRGLVPVVDAVRTDRITVMKFEELMGVLEAPCSISVVRGMPLNSGLIIAFESDLVFQLVDLYFGGTGSSQVESREQLSTAESDLMEMLHLQLLPDISESWKGVMSDKPELALLCSDPRLLDGFNEADSLVATRFEISIGEFSGGFWSIVPWSAIDAVRDSLGENKQNRGVDNAQWQQDMVNGLEQAPVDVVAVLAELRLNLKQVANWKAGDFIPLASVGEANLKIGDTPFFSAHLGSRDGNLALQIDRLLYENG